MNSENLFGSADNGNGSFVGISNAIRNAIANPVRFEPVIAPLTKRRGLDDSRPKLTLRQDNQVYVFGVDDVFAHGKREHIRRANNAERYGSPDYLMLLKVGLLQMFAAYRGKEPIKPNLVLTVPIDQFNDPALVRDLVSSVCGIEQIVDQEGCTLRLALDNKRVQIIPEATAAFWHYAFDAKTLNPRKASSTTGVTVVIDIGFLTTNVGLFEGVAYQRDRGFTIKRGGFGVVVKDVLEYVNSTGRGFDLSRVDRGLQAIAGIAPGKSKVIDLGGGIRVDVAPVYDPAIESLARLISDGVLNAYGESISRAIIPGGGVYHLQKPIEDMMPESIPVMAVPDAADSNALGAYTLVRQQAARKGINLSE